MNKKIFIEGMACMHCKKSVEDALSAIRDVVGVEVSLEEKCASVTLAENLSDELLASIITDIGFEVLEIK